MVPWVMKGKKEKGSKKGKGQEERDQVVEEGAVKQAEDKTFLRYYHLYKKGELERDIEEAGGEVVQAGYEKDNWWAVAVLKRTN